jgi:hypothetical protein
MSTRGLATLSLPGSRLGIARRPARDLQNQRIPHADFSRALETRAHYGDQQCAKYLIAVPLVGRNDDANGLVIRSGAGDGNIRETSGSVIPEEPELSACFNGSLGWNRTNDQRINRTEQGDSDVSGRDKSKT